MQRSLTGLALVALVMLVAVGMLDHAKPEALPTEIGACSETTITEIGYRLGEPDTGNAISYANGGVQISYDTIPEIHRSQVGDAVQLCLVSLPEDCPPATIAARFMAPPICAPERRGKRPTRSTPAAAFSLAPKRGWPGQTRP